MNIYKTSDWLFKLITLVLATILVFFMLAYEVLAEVNPPHVDAVLSPGESMNVEKEVTTPSIPQDPEICFLADTTGSMAEALANVQANAGNIMATVLAAQPDAEFCAAQYRDLQDANPFSVDEDMTIDTVAVQNAINSWTATGGGDIPEDQLNALHEMASGAVNFNGPNRIIVWFGDSSGHDPSDGNTLASTIADLDAAGITVIAIPVETGFGDGLDATGQATDITDDTGGILLGGATPDEVAEAILTGLQELTTDVWYTNLVCSTGLSLEFDPEVHYDVPGGETVVFDETITVDNDDALQGHTLNCSVDFVANSYPDGGAVIGTQTVAVTVPDTTPPLAQCLTAENPNGNNKPAAGSSDLPGAKGGQNEDGFYELFAEDNAGIRSIYVNGFGPYMSGDIVKITEAPGAEPKEKKMGSTQNGNNGKSDAVMAHLTLNTDAVITVTDIFGNVTETTCLVPPLPK